MNFETCHNLVPDNGVEYVIAGEKELSVARKWANEYAERRAVQRLIATAEIIRDSMSIADQPSLHARLRSDIAGLKGFGMEPAR